MATAITTEDELLIIEDNDNIIELDSIEIKQEESLSENIIDFWETETITEEIKNEESPIDLNFDLGWEEENITVEDIFWETALDTSEIKNEEIISEQIEENENNIDFSFDLGETTTEEEKEVISETVENNIISEDTFSFWEESIVPVVVWTTLWDDSSTWDDDINSILENTIKKLQTRKKSIIKIKDETSLKIEKLSKEIKSLQTEVKDHKTEIKEFEKETSKIDENVENLEKMKMK